MKKPKKVNMHVILGALVGFLTAYFVNIEGWWVFWYLESINKLGNISESDFRVIIKPINIVTFIIVFWAFNTKRARKINLNKISVSIIVYMAIAAASAMVMFFIVAILFVNPIYLSGPINVFKVNIVSVLTIFISMGVFITVFLILIRCRVNYIKFLTKEVKKLKTNGFGKTIDVRGEDELAELCKSINSMSIELKERIDKEKQLENNKNELITNVSHDLRTPLTSIMGYVDLIKNKEYKTQEQFEEYIDIIDEKSNNLNKLINELFEYTKLNNNGITMNLTEVDIVSLCEQIIGEYVYIFNKEDLVIEKDIVDKEIIVNLDIEKIVRVLDNLLSNAKKYATKGSTVYIKVFEEDNHINIEISNKTNEIKEEDIKHLFNRFYKGDKSRSESESSGLGLSIAKRIVELHGGNIDVSMCGDVISFRIRLNTDFRKCYYINIER